MKRVGDVFLTWRKAGALMRGPGLLARNVLFDVSWSNVHIGDLVGCPGLVAEFVAADGPRMPVLDVVRAVPVSAVGSTEWLFFYSFHIFYHGAVACSKEVTYTSDVDASVVRVMRCAPPTPTPLAAKRRGR